MAVEQPICPILDCERAVAYNGMCTRHAKNKARYGHAEPVKDWPLIARLIHTGWDVNDRGCWIWRGTRTERGYGILYSKKWRGGTGKISTHRIMWEMHNGPIPDGLLIRHRCDTPACVNPDHLEPGTDAQNADDMADRGRSTAYRHGYYGELCKNGKHDVTKPGALQQRSGPSGPYTVCAECSREAVRRYYHANK